MWLSDYFIDFLVKLKILKLFYYIRDFYENNPIKFDDKEKCFFVEQMGKKIYLSTFEKPYFTFLKSDCNFIENGKYFTPCFLKKPKITFSSIEDEEDKKNFEIEVSLKEI